MKSFIRCVLLVGILTATAVRAATFTVVNTNNADGGSLRQAILDANSAAGADVIEFQITNVVRAILVSSNLPVITEPVTLNGATQPGYVNAPIVELSGNNLAGGLDGLKIATSNSTVHALVIRNFTGDGIEILGGSSNLVEGCYIGLNLAGTSDQGVTLNGILVSNAPNTRIGGTTDLQRNVISGNNQNGVYVFGLAATNSMILGNYIGLNAAGAVGIANGANGVLISNAPQNTVGGVAAGARNLISGNSSSGVRLEGTNAFGNSVLGNFIGQDVTGTTNRPNSANGIYLLNAPSNSVGGVIVAARNLLSGNGSVGVRIDGVNARGNLVRGNYIGADVSGTLARGNSGEGVLIQNNARDNFIGGVDPGAGNVIAFNNNDGVAVAAGTNNAISANAIHSNTGLGFDLGANGILANDAGDPDTGANQLQNYPILSAASNTASSVTIVGSLNSRPATTYALDFFANQQPEFGTNFSEGQFYLGSTNVTTGADGNTAFTVTFPVALLGRLITATATDSTNNTSEFSPYVVSVSTASPLTLTVTTTNDTGASSLRQAILDSNQRISSTNNTINFAIPGAGVRVISPPSGSPLPTISEAVTIDGFTQAGSSPNSLASGNNAVWLIRLDGNSTGSGADGLKLVSSGNLVRGLMITRFSSDGIELATNQNNVIVGNCVGLDEAGVDQGNGADGVLAIASSGNRIGGTAPADRNIISGNQSDGVEINGLSSSNNLILGNILGPDPGGVIDRGNNTHGVFVNGAPNNTIGGTIAGAGNLISGNNPNIEINGLSASNNFILGNLIGPDLTGTTNLVSASSGHGVHFNVNPRFNFVGGTNAGAANIIAFNGSDGVYVQTGTNNTIRANNIFSNSALGIDLDNDGVSANDPGDLDGLANQRQNFPVITNAALNTGSTLIQGFLNSRTNSTYFLDFFASFLRDTTSTNGEGQQYLGSVAVTTGADSNANFSVNLTTPGVAGRWITATATDTNGNTSEFSTAFRAPSTIAGGTFTVINTNHTGPGSLRQAILDNNSSFSGSNNLIRFQIPAAGVQTIFPSNALPAITEPVTIDGYTQTGAQTNSLADGNNAILLIRLDGANAGSGVEGLRLEIGNSRVRGLAITRFNGEGIEIVSTNNLIEGNFIGLDPSGTNSLLNNNGILINGVAGNTVGGTSPAARNVISGNGSDGIEISGAGASNNVVLGNFIGTDASGTLDRGNGQDGVFLDSAPNNVIGGATAAARNVISGNGSDGVAIQNTPARNNQVLNNYIGTDVTGGLPIGNSSHGIFFTSGSPSGNVIGSPNPGGNTIAFNGQDGVYANVGTNNSIRANNIFSNGGVGAANLGIDLGVNGVLANDSPDVATGANLQQNHPVLSNAVANAASTSVQGTLASRAGTTYQIDFFSSIAGDPSGFGEGQKWLGTTNVTTDGLGGAAINATLTNVVLGRFITATATDPNGNTSEFSPWLRASSTIAPLTFTVTNVNDSGPGSLRQALLTNNNAVSATNNLIAFAIPGSGPHTITPLTQLPVPTEKVTIDGYTQSGASPNTLSNGGNAVLKIRLDGNNSFFDGLSLTAIGGNIVRGLSITRFGGDGIETGTNGNHIIAGNYLGLDTDGVTVAANTGNGLHLNNSPGNVIGGATPAARNVISANNNYGLLLLGAGATNNRVEGNFIGTDASGTLDKGNSSRGVSMETASFNTIGGTNAAARNVLSGNNSSGIYLTGDNQGNVIQGNFIGTDAQGTGAIGNGDNGVVVAMFGLPGANFIGGTNAGAGNRIAFNVASGVLVQSGEAIAVRGNNIFSNSTLGIDLSFDFTATANDAGDPDTGANGLQNFPLLTNATIGLASTVIQGALNSKPSTSYQLDFFANPFRDNSGHGEGQQYLGSASVTTGADSNAVFSVTLPAVAIGRQLTATATDPLGNTSEFSPSFSAASTFAPLTFVVTNTLDSGPGSLRQAILDNNATASSTNNLIMFNIPGAGPHFIAPLSPLPTAGEAVTINGFTEPGSSANTLSGGNNAVWQIGLVGTNSGFVSGALTFATSNNIVRGLVIMSFNGAGIELSTPGNVIEGCVLGLGLDSSKRGNTHGVSISSAGNRVGGPAPGARNVISGNNGDGILVNGSGASNNVVQGNLIGTDISGTLNRGNTSSGIELYSAGTLIGGAGAGNVIAGNSVGITIGLPANQTTIKGNRIGNGFGDVPLGNSFSGISAGSGVVVIGGLAAGERNLISGNFGTGVQLSGSATNALILGNYIGTDSAGTSNLANFGTGVAVNSGGATIGGLAAGAANIIAFNSQQGVAVGFGSNTAIRANRIFANGQLGIDLGISGVTSNDLADVDAGPNSLQNFPIITNAVANSSNTVVRGTLNSQAGTVYQLDFFANDEANPFAHGQGQRYLGSTNLTTDGAGNGAFVFAGSALVSGRFISATATDPASNTSEFSPAFTTASTLPGATFTVINTNDSGPGSLRQALLDTALLPSGGNDLINFSIPGTGVRTIAPLTVLPTPLDPVTINGFSQSGSSANTLTNGNNAVILIRLDGTNLVFFGSDGLSLTNRGNVVRGLEIVRFQGNGIDLSDGSSNVISGNVIWSNQAAGVFNNGGSGNRIGGLTPADRNVLSANLGTGVELRINTNSVIQGNFIGTDVAGLVRMGNGLGGVRIDGGLNNLIGPPGGFAGKPAGGSGTPASLFGNPAVMRNVISANSGGGLGFLFNAAPVIGTRVFGNLIGTDVTGTTNLGNLSAGISVSGAVGNIIGGTNENEPNLIAFNLGDGIQVLQNSATNNNIQANSIYDNTGLGIDLQGINGINNNDAGDPDSGPNQLQNFPILTNAGITTSNLIVQGTLNSRPSATYRIEFFANVTCDPSTNGEGKHFLGGVTVTTGADSNAAFNVNLPLPPDGQLITATATDPSGNTSEFCPCRQYGSLIPPITLVVTNTNDSGPGSLRQALLNNNATFHSGPNRIEFNIAGAGVRNIGLLTPLPDITRSVIIDGFTQPGSAPNTSSNSVNGVWLIRLDGTNITVDADGLHFTSSSNSVRGLVIVNFLGDGIELQGGGGSLLEQNLIGLTVITTNSPSPAPPNPPSARRGDISAAGDGSGTVKAAGWGGSWGTPTIGRNGIRLERSRDNRINESALGLVGFSAVFVDGSEARDNILEGNLFGKNLDFSPAWIPRDAVHIRDGMGTVVSGGGAFYTWGSVVRTKSPSGYTVVRPMVFGWVGGQLHDRGDMGRDAFDLFAPYVEIQSATPNQITGRFWGNRDEDHYLRVFNQRQPNGVYYSVDGAVVNSGPTGQNSFNITPAVPYSIGTKLRIIPANSFTSGQDSYDFTVTSPGSQPPTDLAVTKTASSATVVATSNFTYTISVTNRGPADATNVIVFDTLPSGLFFVDADTSWGSPAHSGQLVRFDLGTLTNGQIVTMTIEVGTFFTNTFTNTAVVASYSTPDSNADNDVGIAIVTVVPVPPTPFVQFSQPGFTISEGQTSQFTLVRSGDTSKTGKVDVVFVNGSAFNGQDFMTPVIVPLTFAAGEITKPVPVPTTDDSTPELNEAFLAVLQSPQGLVPNGPNFTTGFIVNNDGPPVNNLSFFPIVVANPADGTIAMDWTGLPGQSHLLCTHSLNDPFHTMPGFAPPVVITPNGAGNPNIFGYGDLLSPDLNKISVPQEFFRLTDTVPTGSITGTVRNPDGTPAVGQIIRIGDSHQVTATAINGTFSIQNVPAGEVPISFEQLVTVSNIVSGQIEYIWIRIVVFVDLVANGQMAINVEVELPKEIPKPACNCIPTCGIVGGTFNGVQKVVAGGGKRGDCTDAPVVVVTGPGGINEGLLGKRKMYSPAANGTWTVTSSICGQTKQCTITLP